MSRINLQNDNNLENENTPNVNKKRGGFFDADENTKDFVEPEEHENNTLSEPAPEFTLEQRQKKNKVRLKKITIILSITLCALLLVSYIANSDFVKNLGSGNPNNKYDNPTKLYLYAPDWETDIYTVEGYLDKKRDIVYSPNGAEFITLEKGSYYQYGGNGLTFITDYLNTIIEADHEKLNGMFTEEYWTTKDEYGKKREKYTAFPKQKLFNIKIVKYSYSDPQYDTANIDDHYYIVSYNIYRNDGMFRDDIDEYSELAQMITVLLDPDGNGQIANIIDLPGYIAGHMG